MTVLPLIPASSEYRREQLRAAEVHASAPTRVFRDGQHIDLPPSNVDPENGVIDAEIVDDDVMAAQLVTGHGPA